jgi:hypothetical protein
MGAKPGPAGEPENVSGETEFSHGEPESWAVVASGKRKREPPDKRLTVTFAKGKRAKKGWVHKAREFNHHKNGLGVQKQGTKHGTPLNNRRGYKMEPSGYTRIKFVFQPTSHQDWCIPDIMQEVVEVLTTNWAVQFCPWADPGSTERISSKEQAPSDQWDMEEWARWTVARTGSLLFFVVIEGDHDIFKKKSEKVALRKWLGLRKAFMFQHYFASEETFAVGWWGFVHPSFGH